jgi:hypothetical protein
LGSSLGDEPEIGGFPEFMAEIFFLLKETILWKVFYKKGVSYDRHKLNLKKSPLRGEMS